IPEVGTISGQRRFAGWLNSGVRPRAYIRHFSPPCQRPLSRFASSAAVELRLSVCGKSRLASPHTIA
ncbi:MAG: hypothetical protein LBD67_01700, partial [Candidatus Accumulibacter sp.]|nr:hypothetical protein [Accumulibacter sp.]